MTLAAIVAVPALFTLVVWIILGWTDHLLNRSADGDYFARWLDELPPARPGSVDATLDEIRGLPETPFDWEQERLA